ncbi:hypothetical protein SDC9_165679 [bioreactor metagenome]|uniref:Uncharacterized protein n=1 Tax=bioreactor metagenome TaxID=1076179 RepID=A0A645FXG4_9ZZZZ
MRCVYLLHAQLLRGGQQPGAAMEHRLAVLVGHLAVHHHVVVRIVLFGHGGGHRQRIAHAHGVRELQILRQVNGAGAGELCAEQRRDECAAPHAVRHHVVEQRALRVFGVHVRGVDVARDGRKGLDVLQRERAH